MSLSSTIRSWDHFGDAATMIPGGDADHFADAGRMVEGVKTGCLVEIFTDTNHIGQAKSFPRPELSPYGVRVPVPPGLGAGKAPLPH